MSIEGSGGLWGCCTTSPFKDGWMQCFVCACIHGMCVHNFVGMYVCAYMYVCTYARPDMICSNYFWYVTACCYGHCLIILTLMIMNMSIIASRF